MLRTEITTGRDDNGRPLDPNAWCAAACDVCNTLGPREYLDSDTDEWAKAMAHAGALSAGFVERIEGRMLRIYCPECAAAAKAAIR